VLVVHCAFSKVKPVEGGPRGLIAALETALKPDGTLVMPSMSYDDDHVFDPKASSAIEMGVG
jgi:aminoglycoside 3-N-acetyltransferase